MLAIADSRSVYYPGRVLPQHQLALSLLQSKVEDPHCTSFRWLDLCCGQGQILTNIGNSFSAESCKKIHYTGIDVEQDYCRKAKHLAEQFFPPVQVRVSVCAIDKFEILLAEKEQFDAITFTNSVHEITPSQLSDVFVAVLCRVKPDGFLFMYDMETLATPELGAIPWAGVDMQKIIECMLREAGETDYSPKVVGWPHNSCQGWYILLNRGYISVPDPTLLLRRTAIRDSTANVIQSLLESKLITIHQALNKARQYGTETVEERKDIERMLYDHFAISSALNLPFLIPGGAA